MGRKVTKIIEDQFRNWRHRNKANQTVRSQKKYYPVITISREFGAQGAALGKLLGERLGFKVWDKELLQAIAKELGSSEKYLETVDERRRKPVEDTVLGFMNNINTNVNYLLSLIRVVKTIEKFGSSIIVGRGASYICQRSSSFHVRVVAPPKDRITGYAGREHLTREEAYDKIKAKDAERADFIRYSFNKEVNTPCDYDLVVNSGIFKLEELAGIIIKAYETKTGLDLQTDRQFPVHNMGLL